MDRQESKMVRLVKVTSERKGVKVKAVPRLRRLSRMRLRYGAESDYISDCKVRSWYGLVMDR